MGTTLSEVYDTFMMTITDYRLNALFSTSVSDFEDYLQSFLNYAISDFDKCDQDLEYSGSPLAFPNDLTRENKNILALLMTKHWLQKNVNDITQMNLHVTDRDFRIASEAANLREKTSYLNTVKEECSQLLQNYEYKKLNWTLWFNQDFDGM